MVFWRVNYTMYTATDQQITKINSLAKALGKAPISRPISRNEASRLISLMSTIIDEKSLYRRKSSNRVD
jgi:hypothetical protein